MNQVQASKKSVCTICDGTIKESVGRRVGEEAIECSGLCSSWLHRRCAGLSKVAFDKVSQTDDPFYCPQCRINKQDLEIKSLRDLVGKLTSEIKTLKTIVEGQKQNQPSYACIVGNDGSPTSSSTTSIHTPIPHKENCKSSSVRSPRPNLPENDRRYNLVISGVTECKHGTSRLARQASDLTRISDILSSTIESISEHSIKDIQRLGKYNVNMNRPRPLLVKLLRATDVSAILANKSSLDKSIRVRRDLPKDIRMKQVILLKERWKLINSGTDRKDIKIDGEKLFVCGSLYGSLDPTDISKFIKQNSPNLTDCNVPDDLDKSPQPTVPPPYMNRQMIND